jgi:cell division control protein 6
MIQDRRAFQPGWTPSTLVHRDGALDHIATSLHPLASNHPGEDVLLTGPSGAGKTTLADYVTKRVTTESEHVTAARVDCTTDSTPPAVLKRLIRNLNIDQAIPRPGSSTPELLSVLEEADRQLLVVLDEVDQLEDRTLLASLYKLRPVTMVLVCIDPDPLLADAHPGVQSRLRTATTVTLDRYTPSELADILLDRAAVGLQPDALSRATAEEIGAVAGGDAHYALAVLRRAADRAASMNAAAISPDIVEQVAEDACRDVRGRVVDQLSTHHRVLYEVVREEGSVAASRLHNLYEERVSAPRSRSSRRRYLAALEQYGLIEKTGATKGATYQHVAQTAL